MMLRSLILAGGLCTALLTPTAFATTSESLNLMPWPQSVETSEQYLTLKALPSVTVSGEDTELVRQAVERFLSRLRQQTGLKAGESSRPISIRVSAKAERALDTASEAYTLTVSSEAISLDAESYRGALHGLETLLQLIGIQHKAESIRLPALTVTDSPRFAWRGLLIDSVRHFFSLETLKRQIDGMAAAKLNVFHWHLTDDQGWRLESPSYPKLHEQASGGQYYTRAQVRELIDYAAARGIHVLPEIDMPGHASAIAVAYPKLMSAPGPYQPEDRWGVHKPLLNPANPAVYEFARAILGEVAELFPFPYVHIGGDEVDPEHWETNQEIQAFREKQKLADSHALHAYFNQRLAEILTQLDRKMIGWDEVLHPDLPKGTVVQSWQGPDALGRAINMGFPALLSTGFYLDQPQYASYHYRVRLLPEPVKLDTTPADDESWSTWRFSAPRKRGSDVAGTLSVITHDKTSRGFIDFKNKSRQVLSDVRYDGQHLSFTVDSWMGPISAELDSHNHTLSGQLLVGNAPYLLTGEKIAGSELAGSQLPEPVKKDLVDASKEPLLLGGEAALWAEIIDENSIDLRLWPRGFVVAERLWSAEELRDEKALYARLDNVSEWSAVSAGLEHFQQQRDALQSRYPDVALDALLQLSSAMEPAHYYHRHHEKSEKETYSRRDPLNRFVDSLPAESRASQDFVDQVSQWLAQPENTSVQQRLNKQLQQWQEAAKAVAKATQAPAHQELHQLADNLSEVTRWGLAALEAHAKGKPLTAEQRKEANAVIDRALNIQYEVIVSAAFGVKQLLHTQP